MEYQPQRHDLVWLDSDSLVQIRPAGGQPMPVDEALDLLGRWVVQGHPLIVARQPEQADNRRYGVIRLGLAMPPSMGKWRLAFDAPISAIKAVSEPPQLQAMLRDLPCDWQQSLLQFLEDEAIASCRPALYGSGAMQALTGLPCLSEGSDLDLLFHPSSRQQYDSLIAALQVWSRNHPQPRIDGEVMNATGWASAWRECASGAGQVLAKSIDQVALLPRRDFESFELKLKPELEYMPPSGKPMSNQESTRQGHQQSHPQRQENAA